MALMGAALSDISSNARLKVYPATEVLQVSNAPIFRAPGWEPQKRSYDVPAKGKGIDPDRALEVSRARARAAVRDIALCNQFDYFITWTLDGSLINRYDADEVNALFEAAKGSKLELPILFGAFYGLRRSEAIGLKWDAIDFDQNTITIRHTVTSCDLDGKRVLVASDTTKTKSSMRTLPLVPFMRERLLTLKEEQQENRRLCGRSYIKEYLEYVCVNEIGDLIKPHYVTESFPKLLKAKGMRQIRYHDLRHSCASLLLANGVPMKQIQEWLGHSDFSTTANIYAHLDYSSKLTSADAMLNGLGFAQN